MLNNLTNFFNLIIGRKIKTSLDSTDLIAIGTRDARFTGNYQPTAIQFGDLQAQIGGGATADTGTLITFNKQKVYNTFSSPGTTNISNDLTGAVIGITQKIYHNNAIAPSMPAGWVLLGNGVYLPGTLNIIYAEWCGGTRVEYWVTQ
jgi:hypothetical protein